MYGNGLGGYVLNKHLCKAEIHFEAFMSKLTPHMRFTLKYPPKKLGGYKTQDWEDDGKGKGSVRVREALQEE